MSCKTRYYSMKPVLLLNILLLLSSNCQAGETNPDTIFAASWNLENLFDTVNDTLKDDEEFLPESIKHWTEERLEKKLYNLARVIHSMNHNRGPDLLGLVEVEHRALLDSLETKFPEELNYSTAYIESPDTRGIDNGLIYRNDLFSLLSVKGDTIILPDRYPTRLILNVDLLTGNKDTLHVFVNHWPSRRGGERESEINRITAARVLRKQVDNILSADPGALILILGDFNDEPLNNSMLNTLKAEPLICDSNAADITEYKEDGLYNLSYQAYNKGSGTYKYRDDWNMLDQIIVSGELLRSESVYYICNSFEIYKPLFIVTHSGKYEGTPFPTFGGNKYLGGYSDHFPVTAKFIFK